MTLSARARIPGRRPLGIPGLIAGFVLSAAVAGTGPLCGQASGPEAGPRITTIAASEPLPSQGRLGGVAADRLGNIYVSNFGASVWRLAPDGRLDLLSNGLRGSSGNAVDRDGSLLQASFVDGRIVRIAPDGKTSDVVSSGLRGPVGLVSADDGSIFVCECRGNAISRIDADGSVSELATSPDLACPNGVTLGPDGGLYVVSFDNGHVVRVDPAGRAERFATLDGRRNAHIAFARGALWVTQIEANRLVRLDLGGHAEPYAGTGALGFDDGPVATSPLARPNGVAVLPGGDALVVNTLDGPWRGEKPTRIVLRRVDLPRRR